MKNYISVNAKHYKKKEINRISEHNFRLQKIGYLLPEEHRKYENVNIIYANNITNKYENNLTKLGEYSQNLSSIYNKKQLDNILKSQYELLLNKKEKIQYKNKSYAKSNESTLVEMVVALSEEQAKAYLESGQDLGKGFDNFTKNLCEKYGFTPLQVSLHLDEGYIENGVAKSNIHAHLTLFNFSFEKERSVLRTLKKQDYKDLQDLAANSFKEVGFDFQRGTNKELSTKEHLERNDFILSKQKQQLENYDLILKSLIPEVNQEKKDLKALLNTFNKDSVEYNLLYNLIGSTMNLEKELRKYSKIEDFNKETRDEIIKLLKRHLEKVEPFRGKDFYKLENSNALIHNLEEFAQKISNVNLEFTENQEKDEIIKDLESKLKDKDSVIEKVSTEKYEERSKNKVLTQDNISKTNEITKLKENHKLEINRLQNDFKQKLERMFKRLNLIKRLKRSNIANKIRLRLSKRKENYDLDR